MLDSAAQGAPGAGMTSAKKAEKIGRVSEMMLGQFRDLWPHQETQQQ